MAFKIHLPVKELETVCTSWLRKVLSVNLSCGTNIGIGKKL